MTEHFTVPDWMLMKSYALKLIEESDIKNPDRNIVHDRIKILHLDHANELLMKSWLLKNGYVINLLNESAFKRE